MAEIAEEHQIKELDPLPAYIGQRQTVWDRCKERYEQELKAKESKPIKIDTFDKVKFDCPFSMLVFESFLLIFFFYLN